MVELQEAEPREMRPVGGKYSWREGEQKCVEEGHFFRPSPRGQCHNPSASVPSIWCLVTHLGRQTWQRSRVQEGGVAECVCVCVCVCGRARVRVCV